MVYSATETKIKSIFSRKYTFWNAIIPFFLCKCVLEYAFDAYFIYKAKRNGISLGKYKKQNKNYFF